jgi:predicted RNA-binding Zn ribbon-like protein
MIAIPDAVFSLCAGHPTLDLVNTFDNRFHPDGPVELLTDYRALLAFMKQSRLLDVIEARHTDEAELTLKSVRELREAAASVLYAVVDGSIPPAADVQTLERHTQSAHQHQKLLWTPGDGESKFVWTWRTLQSEPGLPLWILALQTSVLLTSDALRLLRTCHAETCRWLFLDTSKNHTRRWCDMKVCGNRMKARRFQARRM